MADNEGLLSILECPVCFEYMTPPIYQCLNQHLLCSRCDPTQKKCPICREKVKGTRSLCMEKLTKFVAYPCKYQHNGCKEFYLLKEKGKHEQDCHKGNNCSCSLLSSEGTICKWEGTFEAFEQHIDSMHKNCIKTSTDGRFCFNSDDYDELIICHDEKMFLIRVLKDTLRVSVEHDKVHTHFFHIILLTCNQEDTYLYEVEVQGKHERFEGLVSSIMDNVNIRIAAKQNECLHFMAREPAFTFEGTIRKV